MRVPRLRQSCHAVRAYTCAIAAALVIACVLGLAACRKPAGAGAAQPQPTPAVRRSESPGGFSHAPRVPRVHECTREAKGQVFLDRVDDVVYVMVKGGGLTSVPTKNISWVVTDDGAVVIDAGVPQSARVAKKLIGETTDKPITHIIYTHHHGTQVLGAGVLRNPATKVIAHEDTVIEMETGARLKDYMNRINSIQFDLEPFNLAKGENLDPLLPNVTYKSEYKFTAGQERFLLEHAVGEASDYSIIFMPERGMVWVGDMVALGVPNVASPMKPVRDPVKWKLALELIKSRDPEVLIGAVGPPVCDKTQIAALLDARIAYLDFLYKAVTTELNKGSSTEEAVANTELPPELAENPFLKDLYLSHEFNVRGLMHEYSGWFDQNGSHLNPAPSKPRAASFIRDMGGAQKVLDRAGEFKAADDLALACEYLDLLIEAGELAPKAHKMKSDIMTEMSARSTHRMTASMYSRLAKIELDKAN